MPNAASSTPHYLAHPLISQRADGLYVWFHDTPARLTHAFLATQVQQFVKDRTPILLARGIATREGFLTPTPHDIHLIDQNEAGFTLSVSGKLAGSNEMKQDESVFFIPHERLHLSNTPTRSELTPYVRAFLALPHVNPRFLSYLLRTCYPYLTPQDLHDLGVGPQPLTA